MGEGRADPLLVQSAQSHGALKHSGEFVSGYVRLHRTNASLIQSNVRTACSVLSRGLEIRHRDGGKCGPRGVGS